MKLGTLVAEKCKIIYRLGPTSEMPLGGSHLEFLNGHHIRHIFAYKFEIKADRPVLNNIAI